MKRKFTIMLIIIFALSLRLIYVVSISEEPIADTSDEKDYDNLSLNLATGKGYVNQDGGPTSRRAPLVPVFFGLIYRIFGHDIMAVRIGQALLGTLTCFIIYLLGKDVFSKRVGLVSALIAAMYPSFITFTGRLLSETLLIFLLVLSLYLLLKKNGSTFINSFLSGLSFGLASLTRPSILLLPLTILFVSATLRIATLKETTKKAMIVIIAMFIVIIPWSLRNYYVHKKFVLVNTQLGYALLTSYFYPKTGFGFQNEKLENRLTEGINSELEKSRILTRYTIDNVMKDPGKFIRLLPLKFLWLWEPFDGRDYGFTSSYNIVYGLVFLFFLLGAFGSRTMKRDLLPLYITICYFVLVSLIFYSSRRFRMQIEPFIIILASYGLFWTAERWKKNRLIQAILIIGLVGNLLFFFLSDRVKTFSRKTANIFGYNNFSKYAD